MTLNIMTEICGVKPLTQQVQPCSVCGEQGKKVRIETLKNLIKADRHPNTFEGYYLCTSNKCNVIYYGQQIFYKEDVKVKVWFKEEDLSVPVCYCKDVTKADIFEHVAVRGCCTNIEDIQKHTGANTGKECLTQNPAGT
jgi:bacterioferritin-associated ferredoxin